MRKILIATTIVATGFLFTSYAPAATFVDVVTRPHNGAWQWQCASITSHAGGIHSERFYGGWRGPFTSRAAAENAARC